MTRKVKIFYLLTTAVILLASCQKDTTLAAPTPKPPVVVANNLQTVQLPANSITLTGSGTSTNGKITGYLWSLVSGPNVPVITSPSSPTTNVNGLIAGTYVLQFAVIDSIGLTGVDTLSVVVKPAVQKTITIQPTNNIDEGHADSYNVVGGSGDTELEIGSWTIGGTPTNWRSYIKFDQSQIPAGSTIISATLYLYSMPIPHAGDPANANSGTANAFYVERVTSNWTGSSLNYSNLPTTSVTNRVLVPQSTAAYQDITINVTALVQDMLTSNNYGFGLKLQNEVIYNFRGFASSFHANAAIHPKLVITYQ